jgi:hypothetical protein
MENNKIYMVKTAKICFVLLQGGVNGSLLGEVNGRSINSWQGSFGLHFVNSTSHKT